MAAGELAEQGLRLVRRRWLVAALVAASLVALSLVTARGAPSLAAAQLMARLMVQLMARLMAQLMAQLMARLMARLMAQPVAQPVARPEAVRSWSGAGWRRGAPSGWGSRYPHPERAQIPDGRLGKGSRLRGTSPARRRLGKPSASHQHENSQA